MDGEKFSGMLQLTGLNDFIGPGQTCINHLSLLRGCQQRKRKRGAAAYSRQKMTT